MSTAAFLVVLVALMAAAFGAYCMGRDHGVRDTERRWREAVSRADAARLREVSN